MTQQTSKSEPTLAERKVIYKARRGLKELDFYLDAYVRQHYLTACPADKASFAHLLDYEDPELLLFFLGQKTPDDSDVARLIDMIKTLKHADWPAGVGENA